MLTYAVRFFWGVKKTFSPGETLETNGEMEVYGS